VKTRTNVSRWKFALQTGRRTGNKPSREESPRSHALRGELVAHDNVWRVDVSRAVGIGACIRGCIAGHIEGYIAGHIEGCITGHIEGCITGHIEGYIVGHIEGYITGDIRGHVTGHIGGYVHGHIGGYVHGHIRGYVHGHIRGYVEVARMIHWRVDGDVDRRRIDRIGASGIVGRCGGKACREQQDTHYGEDLLVHDVQLLGCPSKPGAKPSFRRRRLLVAPCATPVQGTRRLRQVDGDFFSPCDGGALKGPHCVSTDLRPRIRTIPSEVYFGIRIFRGRFALPCAVRSLVRVDGAQRSTSFAWLVSRCVTTHLEVAADSQLIHENVRF
jgi:hypothetical protein